MPRRLALPAAVVAVAALAAPAAALSPVPPALTVAGASVAPGKIFLGRDPVRIAFTPTAASAGELHVEVVAERGGRIARRIVLTGVFAGVPRTATWDGTTAAGTAAADGRYRVRVVVPGTAIRRALGTFTLRGRMYPIRGPHADRPGSVGRFGVPRSGGRTHEGYDVTAPCGTPLVAARAGTVVRSHFDPVLYGHEVIVRGLLDGREYRYAHLRRTPLVRRGDTVRTGQRIGEVGDTGNARSVGCHLHFELREGGRPIDPRPRLHEWDRFS